MYRLDIKDKSGNTKAVRINGKYCGENCEFKKKMFQGYGGWLGLEVEGCILSGQLTTQKGNLVRCIECLEVCKYQVEKHNNHWIKED